MPIRMLIAGDSFTLLATILGCFLLIRTRQTGGGIWWVIGGLTSALIGMLLWGGIGYLPNFATIVVANETMLLAFVLLHQAVASMLASPRRLIELSCFLLIAQFLYFCHFLYADPNMQARVLVRTATVFIQVFATAILLFRHRDIGVKYAAHTAGGIFAFFALLQSSQFISALIQPPAIQRLQPTPISAFYYIFNFMAGMACWFAVVWLAICERRKGLQVMATTDGLTGLLNRAAFDEALRRELRSANRRHKPLALLLLDIDHFKAINDHYGHPTGDKVIRRVSRLLRDNVRSIDSVARYGGDEFAVLLKGMDFDQAEVTAERLRLQIEQLKDLPQCLAVTSSVGIALRRDSDTAESLFKRSDEAMYLSKRLGRNRASALEFTFQEP